MSYYAVLVPYFSCQTVFNVVSYFVGGIQVKYRVFESSDSEIHIRNTVPNEHGLCVTEIGHNFIGGGSRIYYHNSETYQFHFIVSGSGTLNGEALEKGDVILIKNGETYEERGEYEQYWINILWNRSANFFDYLKIDNEVHLLKLREGCTDLLQSAFKEALENDISVVGSDYYMRALFYKLLSFFKSENSDEQEDMTSTDIAKQYIQRNYAEEINLKMIAKAVGLSPKYLSALFVQRCNVTIGAYIKNIRIESAKIMLEKTGISIGEVSRSVGYQDAMYFSKLFKKSTGVSPKSWRKNKKQQVIKET